MESPDLTVVIMAYNECASITAVFEEIQAELARLAVSSEILIIDDGSTDATPDIADRLAQQYPSCRVIHHRPNQGLGGVYRTAFGSARGAWLTFFPADGQFEAGIIGMYLPLREKADLILGYLPERNGPIAGKILSMAERTLLRLLFGPFPRFQGILMFRRSLLDSIPLVSRGRGWTILMEFILKAVRAGTHHISVPISLRPRREGRSKVNNLRSIYANVRQLLKLRLRL